VNANGNGTGSGHGLTGMRERAALCGGALDAGPRRDGGWSVIARLPYEKA
jgi:signal transduction histidine kinase